VAFPIQPPIEPMLAKPQPAIPEGSGWHYEPKWDGFRALVFRDGPEVFIQSRDLKPLNRYFPELEEPLRAIGRPKDRFVLDGEIVIATDGELNFDALLLRIHPAASRVAMLAGQTPSSYVAFDLLAVGANDLREKPFAERRRHRSISRRIPPTRRPLATGSRCSRGPGWTEWSPSPAISATCPASGR
jgi:ATP-dependent DNA ligase